MDHFVAATWFTQIPLSSLLSCSPHSVLDDLPWNWADSILQQYTSRAWRPQERVKQLLLLLWWPLAFEKFKDLVERYWNLQSFHEIFHCSMRHSMPTRSYMEFLLKSWPWVSSKTITSPYLHAMWAIDHPRGFTKPSPAVVHIVLGYCQKAT